MTGPPNTDHDPGLQIVGTVEAGVHVIVPSASFSLCELGPQESGLGVRVASQRLRRADHGRQGSGLASALACSLALVVSL
jgi:hypothetical protein